MLLPLTPALEAGMGRPRQGARHVSDTQRCNRRGWHRYRQELVPRRRARPAWRDCAAAEVVSVARLKRAWPTCRRVLSAWRPVVGAHHLSRKLNAPGHDARLMPAQYVRPYSKGQKNDFRDAEAIAEAVQRPTMKFGRHEDRGSARPAGLASGARAPGQPAHQHYRSNPRLPAGARHSSAARYPLLPGSPPVGVAPPEVLSPRMVRVVKDFTAFASAR